jgi:hypothetical protein
MAGCYPIERRKDTPARCDAPMQRRLTKRPSVVKLDLSIFSFRDKQALLRKLDIRRGNKKIVNREFAKISKKCGGMYDNHTRRWRFESEEYAANIKKNGRVEYSPIPFGMKASKGKNDTLKLSYGKKASYELIKISGEEIAKDFKSADMRIKSAIEEGAYMGMNFFRVRLGQANAFWQKRIFAKETLESEISILLNLIASYSVGGRKFDIYVYGFKDDKKAIGFVKHANRVRKQLEFIRRRNRK